MSSRTCPIHGSSGLRSSAATSSTSSTQPCMSSDDWKLLRDGIVCSQSQQEMPARKDNNAYEPCDPKKHQRSKQAIAGLLLQVRRIQDAPQIAGYISGILKAQTCNPTMYSFVKDTMLASCRSLKEEVACYCTTEASLRLQPMIALLGHLVKRGVIPAGPVLALAEAFLQEIDKPYRIECVSLLLIDPESGILTDRKYAYLLERSLKQMQERKQHMATINRC